MSLRLTLICHAATAATRQAAFPLDEALEPGALRRATALAGRFGRPGPCSQILCSPTLRARQTASALGLEVAVEPALADLDLGRWAGRKLDDVAMAEPEALAVWMRDPSRAPHGGESVQALLVRVSAWLGTLDAAARHAVAVTHPAVMRAAVLAALNAPATAFWRIDIAPLCVVRLQGRGGTWTLREIAASGSATDAAPTTT